ncbi:hypothetical protein ACFLZ8_02125, partial [Planctomycetota bacterium]
MKNNKRKTKQVNSSSRSFELSGRFSKYYIPVCLLILGIVLVVFLAKYNRSGQATDYRYQVVNVFAH